MSGVGMGRYEIFTVWYPETVIFLSKFITVLSLQVENMLFLNVWVENNYLFPTEKTPGTSGPLTLWLCCSWNKLLVCLAGGELAPRLSLVSPKVFSPFCHRWSFGSLPLSPLACLVGESSFPAKSSTWLHRYYLNWTELDNAITKFNNEMHSAEDSVLNPVILHYWHNLPILILCSALLQFVLLKALYK